MTEDAGQEDKQYEPSQKKLDDARIRGDVPKSTDLTTAAAYGGFLVAAITGGASSLVEAGRVLSLFMDQANGFADLVFDGGGNASLRAVVVSLGYALTLWAALPALFALCSVIAQRGLVFAPSKLAPKVSRISPIQGAVQKFGRDGLFEFFKSTVKMTVYCVVLAAFLMSEFPHIMETMRMTPGIIGTTMLGLTLKLLFIVFLVALTFGALDLLWQRARHTRKNRMSRQELQDENKQSEGDPHLKQQRRQRGMEIALNKMLTDVPGADVIIVNPQHFAVVLKWDRKPGRAPVCVAKGVDAVAARIREIGAEHHIPIHQDPPTARALHSSVSIGDEIQPKHYKAVAAAIRFAEAVRKQAQFR